MKLADAVSMALRSKRAVRRVTGDSIADRRLAQAKGATAHVDASGEEVRRWNEEVERRRNRRLARRG